MYRKSVTFAAVLMLVGAFGICREAYAGNRQVPPSAVSSAKLRNKDILGLVKAGLPADIIVTKIQASDCSFDTSPGALEELKSAGVPDEVILAMIKSTGTTRPKGGQAEPDHGQAAAAAKASNRTAVHQVAAVAVTREGRSLWIARFSGQPKAAAAIASVQQGDLAVLQQGDLFKEVSSFASNSKQPTGTWLLSAREISYAGGSVVKRVMVGFGTGRAHIILEYKLRDPEGSVVWTKKIKSEPSFWASSGAIGGIQNQGSFTNEQPQKLMDALSKFFVSQN